MKSNSEMAQDFERFKVMEAARSKVGLPYQYGGNGPMFFDCSGFVCYCLRHCETFAGDKLPDLSAQKLFYRFQKTHNVRPGCIACYGKGPNEINHVMLVNWCFEGGFYNLIGARGGGETTRTVADAFAQGAFVSCVSSNYWRENFKGFVDPWKGL
jgi:hypothetical protein